MMIFHIDIENAAGQKLGSGPITSASEWTYTARMDRAGDFAFSMPASDLKAGLVQKKRIARAYALLDGAWTEVGAGIIDQIERQPGPDGTVTLRVAGNDLLRELTYRSVLNLKLYSGNAPVSHAVAVAAVGAYAPPGWSFSADPAPGNDSVYGYFNGDSVLAGCVKIADKSQSHFRRGAGRVVQFRSTFQATGVRAIQAAGDLGPETCAITSLTERLETYDLLTRIYPRGSGNADVQLTLRATTRTAPDGYTLNATQNYIENDTATATYGRIERQLDFREIGPVENTTPDVQAAANALFDAALETLRRQSEEIELASYELEVAECSRLLRPLESIHVDYRDPDAGLNIGQELNILEASWQVDSAGVRTTRMIVANADRWPDSDVAALVDSIEGGRIYQALPQLNANSYTTGYTKNLDDSEIATIRFRFGNEVTQLQQVLLEFQLLPFESTVKTIAGATSGSGTINTSAPSVNSTGSGGNDSTGTGGPTATDTGGPTATGAATGETGGAGSGETTSATPAIGSTTPSIGSGGSGDTGSTTPTIGSTTPTIGSTTPTIGSTTPTIGSTALTSEGTSLTTNLNTDAFATELGGDGNTSAEALVTGGPQGGDVISGGRHIHFAGIGPYMSGSTHALWFIADGDNSLIVADGASGNFAVNVSGNHTHALSGHTHSIASHIHSVATHTHVIPSHTHTISSHTHTIAAHTHTIAAHTHTIAAHTHTISAHTHTISSHTHTIAAHTHTIASHTHTIAAHTHTVGSHTHTVSSHTHTIAQHTHSLSQHTHSLNNHTHDLSESLTAIYGIFREDLANTYGIDDLEYRINLGSWVNLNTATDIGGSWWRLDITGAVMDAGTFRPVAESNRLDIRRRAAAPAEKTVTIDALLSVRNTIQAITYV